MFNSCPVLFVIPHVDAGDRTKWIEDQDLRPLTALGREQAETVRSVVGTVDAVFSSPARRCVETVQPIAQASGVDIVLLDELRELTYVTEHRSWDPWTPASPMADWMVAAAGLGRILRAVTKVAERLPTGRAAVCAHGDLVPLFALLVAGYLGVPATEPIARGGCYEIDLAGERPRLGSLGPVQPKR